MNENKKIIVVDWLQVSGTFFLKGLVDVSNEKKGIFIREEHGLYISKREFSTKDFKSVYNVQYADRDTGEIVDFACVTCDWNFKEKLNKDLQILKVYNSALYRFSLSEIHTMINHFFCYDRIMRIDICADFLRFDNIDCENFIKKVASMNILPNNTGKTVSIVSKNRHYESCTVGTRNSICRSYLYNKTKELKDSGKEYINRLHEFIFNTKKDVWRLEFSILQTSQLRVGGRYVCDISILEIDEYMACIYDGIYNEFWQFKTNETRRKTTTATPVLFVSKTTSHCQKRKYQDKNTHKTDKIVFRALMKLNDELRNLRVQQIPQVSLDYFLKSRNLERWADNNTLFVINRLRRRYNK